jgi:hypothetical protein
MANFWTKHPQTLAQRFLCKVQKTSTCWWWKGAKIGTGYGTILVGKRTELAHRAAYEMFVGPIPAKMQIDHICSNKACVNPEHLRLATHSQNLYNCGRRTRNTSGYKGVTWNKKEQKWVAQISAAGIHYNLGYFDAPDAAYSAYCAAAENLHGKFFNDGA